MLVAKLIRWRGIVRIVSYFTFGVIRTTVVYM
jgi:hypothetical protein